MVQSKTALSNGAIAVTFRVNNDPASDYRATLYVNASTTSAAVQTWQSLQQQAALDQYNAMQAAQAAIASIL